MYEVLTNMTTYREALNKTIDIFGIVAAEISRESGIDESRLSRFRTGKHDLQSKALASLINAMPEDAKAYFYLLVMSNGHE
jgi:hypothetical protein